MAGETTYAGLLAASAAVSTLVGVLAWRKRPNRGAGPLALISVGVTWWQVLTLVAVLVPTATWTARLASATYVGVVVAVYGWALFVLDYAGYDEWLTRRTLAVLAVEPVVVVGLVATNGWHHLFWTGVRPAEMRALGLTLVDGPAFVGHLAYSYLLVVVGLVLLTRWVLESPVYYGRQYGAVVLGVAAPALTDALFELGAFPWDLTPVSFSVTGALLLWATGRYGFIDVTPVARDVVVEHMRDGLLVVDGDGRLTDVNDRTRELLGLEGPVIGSDVESVFAHLPGILSLLGDPPAEAEVTVDGRHLSVRVTPLTDDRGRQLGRLCMLHDVTDQKERERALQHQNDRLDQFTSVVSHDLRGPLSVAEGYAATLAADYDDERLETVRTAHDRMEALLEDLLALARHGQTVEELEPTALEAAATRAWGNVGDPTATLRVETDAVVEADEDRLLQALENLFRNAVEHGTTDPRRPADGGQTDGGGVTVTVDTVEGTDGDPAGFHVSDDGPGLPEEDVDQVFDDGYTTSEDGTGLGLTIVENIVTAHGWSVRAEESPTGGARFTVTGVEFVDDDG